jgi:hypothetical protein
MNFLRKSINFVLIMFIFLVGFFVMRSVYRLGKEGMPSSIRLEGIAEQIGGYLGIRDASDRRIINKTTFLLVEQYIYSPRISDSIVQNAVKKMHENGWVDGKSRSMREVTLCKDRIVADIDTSPPDDVGYSGYLGISWGTASARCP